MTVELVIPTPRPRRASRNWIKTRVCRCGECRFHPPRKCQGTGEAVQLYVTEPHGGIPKPNA